MLRGKLAFVTDTSNFFGAGSGIGKATCQVLSREGATIIAADKNFQNAKETIKSLPNKNEENLCLEVDVSSSSSVENSLKNILQHHNKPPSIIVNSAGIFRETFLLKLPIQEFEEIIQTNLKGTFLATKIFSEAIIESDTKNASIINISSIASKWANLCISHYAASKAGVLRLTETTCKELGKFGIRCNSVLPGIINTPMAHSASERAVKRLVSMVPLGRIGLPEEVTEVVAFLASEKSSYVNGAAFEVTGGFDFH